jgi:hypothetical protein
MGSSASGLETILSTAGAWVSWTVGPESEKFGGGLRILGWDGIDCRYMFLGIFAGKGLATGRS